MRAAHMLLFKLLGRFWGFGTFGTRCTDGVKFVVEESTKLLVDSTTNLTHVGAWVQMWGLKNWKYK